jgi:drug/metabolite transporter (DMT)-like permease
MPRLALLDHAGTGSQAEYLEDKTRHKTHLVGPSRLKQSLRTPLFVAIVISGDLVGNVLLRAGMRGSTALPAIVHALLYPWVLVGVLLLIVGVVAQLALLSWADLSYVTPMTSIGYVLTALAGKLFLHEPLAAARWAAIFLIAAGVALVSSTPYSTAGGESYGGRR